ncbi:MAG: sigma 54-interacting transcriptional regulator [Myxococcales bacterium]|nr:sigma 54-interacting transcriptional regulator [Myxococcales bacterium]
MSMDGDEPRAFVVTRLGEATWVTELPVGDEVMIGAERDATIRLDGADVTPAGLRWDGEVAVFRADGPGWYVGGKRFEGSVELKPGDELAVGSAQLVLGVSVPLTAGGRRTLTHHEFRERLYEELARAVRGGRHTCLAMVRAPAGDGGRVTMAALEAFRAGDLVGTYAPDEPEVLLPDTDGETARRVLSRVLANADIEGASVGLAVAPEHGDSPERLLRAAREALREAERRGETVAEPPPRAERARNHANEPLVADDPATRHVVETLESAAKDGRPVLLVGEKSAGKSVWAWSLHELSRGEGDAPFVTIHCAGLFDEAHAEHDMCPEQLERAVGGTLFLDEIGDLPAAGQARLLAWLEAAERDVRIVATTHRALRGLVEREAFEEALYDRLAGHVVEVPALRNRPGDILPMATHFARQAGALEPLHFSPGAIARLRSYPWPGNALELRNALERAVRLARDGEILAEHLPSEPIVALVGTEGRLREHVDSVERDAIIKALAESNHNQTHAAKRLGVSRRALIYKMEKYGLKRPPKGTRRPA